MNDTTYLIKQLKEGYSLEDALKEATLPTVGQYLMTFVYKQEASTEIIADLAGLNKTTLYRISKNQIRPSANVLIRLSRILEMNIEETQMLLKCGKHATLSKGTARDIIIMEGIIKNKCVSEINEKLIAHDFPDLYTNR